MEPFRFQHFTLRHEASTQRIGTDSVLLASAMPLQDVHTVLDIGSGCGVVGFCIADRLRRAGVKDIAVTGVDIDAVSIQEAQGNAACFPSPESIQFEFQLESLQEHVRLAEPHHYDLIVSNPPFFVSSLKPADERRRQARHTDGTLSFHELVAGAAQLLSPSGHFGLILPYNEFISFEKESQGKLHLSEQWLIRPTPAKPIHRVIAIYFLHPTIPTSLKELCIRNSKGHYTEEYRQLTGELYLKTTFQE